MKPRLLLLFLLVLAAAPASAASLSVRTSDGLVVIHGETAVLIGLQQGLGAHVAAGATSAGLLQYLLQNHADGLRAEAYTAETLGTGVPIEAQATVLETTVEEAARNGHIPAIQDMELYEAYSLIRMRGDTFMLLGAPPPGQPEIHHSVFVFSSTTGTDLAGIFLDGKRIVPQGPMQDAPNGYKFLVLDPQGRDIIATAEFRTYEEPDSAARMQAFLQEQPGGALLVGAIKWGPGVYLSPGAVEAMWQYGSAADPDPQILSSQALIGKKGLPKGQALEQTAVNNSSRVTLFSAGAYITPDNVADLNPAPGSRIIAIAGTAPGDTVFIVGRSY